MFVFVNTSCPLTNKHPFLELVSLSHDFDSALYVPGQHSGVYMYICTVVVTFWPIRLLQRRWCINSLFTSCRSVSKKYMCHNYPTNTSHVCITHTHSLSLSLSLSFLSSLSQAGHFPLPRPPIQNGGAGLPRNWSSSIVDSIPDFQPPVVYEDIPESEAHISNFDTEGYGKLNFKDIPHGARSPPILVSPEHEGGPRRGAGAMGGARHTSPTPRPTHPASSSRAMVPARKGGRRDYEDLDLDEGDEEEQRRSVPATAPENYSRLEREKSPARKFSPPDKPTPYKSGGKPHPPPTSNRPSPHGPPLPSRPHVPPSSAKPSDIPTDVPDGLYAAVSKPKKRTAATVHGSRPLLPPTAAKPSLSGSNPDLSKLGSEDYGKLDRRVPVAVPHPEDEYNTLDLVASKMNGSAPSVGQEAYGKLEHISSRGFSVVTSPPHVAEQYGKLELTKTNASVVPPASHYEMQEEQSPSLPSTSSAAAAASIVSPQGKEYGKLHQFSGLPSSSSTTGASGAAVTPSRSQPLPPPQEEYGRLERPTGKTVSVPSTPEDEYGHLETRPRTSSFNPYGTLSAEEMKAAAAQASTNKNGKSSGSAGNADSQVMGPPPGYENTEIKQPSPAYRASVHVTSSQSLAKPQAPPRGTNASPPLQKKTVHGYVNIDEKGQVKKGSPPLPPAKPHLESFTPSARAHSKSTTDSTSTSSNSHDPSLKSHDPTPLKSHGMNGASFPVKRKPIVSSSDYEDTEKLDFGTKPAGNSQKFISTSNIAVLPPTAPRRGASIRSAVSASNVVSENSSKPSVAPKPSKVKLRQAVH